jgi:hypothetical protein
MPHFLLYDSNTLHITESDDSETTVISKKQPTNEIKKLYKYTINDKIYKWATIENENGINCNNCTLFDAGKKIMRSKYVDNKLIDSTYYFSDNIEIRIIFTQKDYIQNWKKRKYKQHIFNIKIKR